jgi:hypothetical protein
MADPKKDEGTTIGGVKTEDVKKTGSGLLVVTKEEKEAAEILKKYEGLAAELGVKPKRFLKWRGSRHHDVLGIDVKTEVNTGGPRHKLSEEDRKQRRADNKAMKKLREKTRGRKKHGRH